jgi:ribosomal protein S10
LQSQPHGRAKEQHIPQWERQMHSRLLQLYVQRDEIESMIMHPNFAASELDRAELMLEGIEAEMRDLINDNLLFLRNQA